MYARVAFTRPPLVLSARFLGFSLVSGVLFALPNALGFAAAQHIGVGFVTLSMAFPLVITYALAVSLGLEKINAIKCAGVVSGVIGAVLLSLSKNFLEGDLNFWIIASLCAPVLLSIGNIFRSRYWPPGVPPAHLSLSMMAFGFLTLVCLTGILGMPIAPTVWSLNAGGLLLAQTLVFTLLYDLYFRLQHLAGPVYLSQIGSVSAVIGALLAYAFFAEIPSTLGYLAILFVGLGVYAVSRPTNATR
jgi:drug/metabolite transporter (DMT)-like permease